MFSGNPKYVLTSGGTLIVTGVDADNDTGVYQCEGTNKKGTQSDTVTGKLETSAMYGMSCAPLVLCGQCVILPATGYKIFIWYYRIIVVMYYCDDVL